MCEYCKEHGEGKKCNAGYLIYYTRKGEEIDEFVYLLDALSYYQVLNNKAEVHAQIGINCAPCPRNCSFCAFAAKNEVFKESIEISIEDAVSMAHNAEREGANALFIMMVSKLPKSGKFLFI